MSLSHADDSEVKQNWASNYSYKAARWHQPETAEQLQELVGRCRKVKVLGSRHSFNDIADTTEDLISLEKFDYIEAVDRERRTVTIGGGVRYGQLCRQLHNEGFALPNLASLPHISVAGACATATHGSGDGNGNLATVAAAMEIVTADGETAVFSRDQRSDEFSGAVVGLGGLGVVTKLTLDVIPTFAVRQDVYENLPLAQLADHFDDITARAYSVSFFTNWRDAVVNQVWLKRRVTANAAFEVKPELFGATPAREDCHPIRGVSAVNCTKQMGVAGPWYDRLPHFRLEFTPSHGEELQSEYILPRYNTVAALHALSGLQEQIAPLLQISEIRTIAGDNLWLSMCYQQDCVAFHFTWKKDWPNVQQVLPLIEERLAPLEARPHWGKLFTMPAAQVQSLYAKLPAFQQLLRTYDPQGKFRNAFLDTYIFGAN